MGLDMETASRLANSRLAEWRAVGYRLNGRAMLDNKELRRVAAEDGKRYSVVSYAIDDGDGRIRMSVAVDDGGVSAWAPYLADELMNPDRTFVE